MNLVFITRKVDSKDSRAGFVTDWLVTLAQNVDRLFVVCQEKGALDGLPANVEVYSLGKEQGFTKPKQFFVAQKLLFPLVKKSAGVFAHQMPLYAVLAAPAAKFYHRKLIQWYTHKSIDWRLRLANLFVNEYISASAESFRLKTTKPVHIFGHGININKFQTPNSRETAREPNVFKIISVGRISPSKDYESMIKAVFDLKEQGIDRMKLIIVGAPALVLGFDYFQKLQTMVASLRLEAQITFTGGLPPDKIISYLQNADLFLNFSDTGSLDKAVLEAMAAGCLVLTSNESFKSILPAELFTAKDQPGILASKIKNLMNLSADQKEELKKMLRQEVVVHHNLTNLAQKIISLF